MNIIANVNMLIGYIIHRLLSQLSQNSSARTQKVLSWFFSCINTGALCLLGKCSTTWAMPPSPFLLLIIFQIGFCMFVQSWLQTMILLLMPPAVVGITSAYHHAQIVGWDGDLVNFLPRLFLNCNPTYLLLPNSWDYRHAPSCPASLILI
jgi:hypothetical protein